MSDFPGQPRFRAACYGNGVQVTAVVIVVTGVVLLAVAAFLVSYAGIRQIAVAAGVSPAVAGLYPLIVDAVLVVACVAALALRGAGWQMQGYAWLSVIVLLAVAGAVHAAGISLSHRPAAAAVAALPWALFLLGFGLLLSMLRHLRTARAAKPGDPGTARWCPGLRTLTPPIPRPSPPSKSQPAPTRSKAPGTPGSNGRAGSAGPSAACRVIRPPRARDLPLHEFNDGAARRRGADALRIFPTRVAPRSGFVLAGRACNRRSPRLSDVRFRRSPRHITT